MAIQGQKTQEELQRAVKGGCASVKHPLLKPLKTGFRIELS